MADYKDVKKKMEMLIKEDAAAAVEQGSAKGKGKGQIPRGEEARGINQRKPGKGARNKNIPKGEQATWVQTHGLSPNSTELPDMPVFDEEDGEALIQNLIKVGLPQGDLGDYDLDSDESKLAMSLISADMARERQIFPLTIKENPEGSPILVLGISDPLNIVIVDDIRLKLPDYEVEAVFIDEGDIIEAIDSHYGMGDESIEKIIDEENAEETDDHDDVLGASGNGIEIDLATLASEPPVIKLANLLLVRAISERASDLHIEPFAGQLRIRYRVDGVLREIQSPPKTLQVGLMTRIKVMSGMNIAETRIPQDGRIRLSFSGKEIDLRVASIPTVYGESIVMRVLDKSTMMIGIQQLGLQKEVLTELMSEAKKPNGLILVTGPTGSGKTTTLYSLLGEVFDSGLKFITTEDPVEYELPGIVQVNINPRVNLTFAACLRSILRQDPDVILVGEIRDVETATIGIQAALTGHMVYSTLHTNSAAATVTRLVDMGIEPFLLTSTLRAVIGQRLIRTICPACRAPYIPSDEELEEFAVKRDEVSDIEFQMGQGCDDCNFSGHKGRLGIYEFLKISEEINELILQRSTTDDIHALATHQGMQSMRADGWLKICLGVTSFEEVSKQTPRETEESAAAELASAKRSMARIEATRKQREAEDNRGFDDENDDMEVPKLTE